MSESTPEISELIRFQEDWDEDGSVHMWTRRFRVVKRTRKGVWIETGRRDRKNKFVLLEGLKRFAYLTEPEALDAFIHRKRVQRRILASRLDGAALALEAALKLKADSYGGPDITVKQYEEFFQ